ncbi:hypothetical protein [Desulforamulus aquiferis]|uniref:Uncharacterized protein n=1 Tax=Desulforamulus aquiferis TaxID=1397668 RepID=A0AAW7ZG71_9FIRM|nr:hypothetical protein [Desulforamulus aquiferis]MDO7788794.1 hypothetical protein [Desulforamulus aquiferis]
MKYLKSTFWLMIMIGVTTIYNYRFKPVLTIGGQVGDITPENTFASIIYLISWLALSVVCGYWQHKEALIAAIIYSLMPYAGVFVGSIFAWTPLVVLITIPHYWKVPIQGVCYEMPALEQLVLLLLPVIFLVGYDLGKYLKLRIKFINREV